MKLTEANDGLKSKTKELEAVNAENKALEKNVADFRSKLGDEVNAKARVDTDYIRATKVNKHLEEICRKKGLWDSIEKDTEDVNDDDKRSLSPGSVKDKCKQFGELGK